MNCELAPCSKISERLTSAIAELRALQEPLLSGEVEPQVLTEFREALNRMRNAAWAAQQSAAGLRLDPRVDSVASFLASERIRAAYQLCKSIRQDLGRDDIELQKGQVVELYGAAKALVDELKQRL